MKGSDNGSSPHHIDEILDQVRAKGVRLWSENGELRYRAPKGALTRAEIVELTMRRHELIAFLQQSVEGGVPASPAVSKGIERAPLGLSQLYRWQLLQTGEVSSLRQVACALRLQGRLNVEALSRSIAEIVRRQDALRTVIVVRDGAPLQEVTPAGDYELLQKDLRVLAADERERQVDVEIQNLILEPLDIAVGPLFAARLLKTASDDHVLMFAMEHLISDGFSRSLLLRDLLAAYVQISAGRPCALPQIRMQFAEYTRRQRAAECGWRAQHGEAWHGRLAGCCRLRFPERRAFAEAGAGWQTVPVRIDGELRARLSDWCRTSRTTLAMSVFTAYASLVLRWCAADDAVFRYQSDGRVSAHVHETIGFFAAELYLRISLSANDSCVDLLERVTQEYCRAYEHVEFSDLAVRLPRPEFTRNTLFNWLPHSPAANEMSLHDSQPPLRSSPIQFRHPMLRTMEFDSEPSILLFDRGSEIAGNLHFPLSRFDVDDMQRFARNLNTFVAAMVERPGRRVHDIQLQA